MRIFYRAEVDRIQELLGGSFNRPLKNSDNLSRTSNGSRINKLAAPFLNSARRFEEDYPPFLIGMASAVRTGLDPLSAIRSVQSLLSEGSLLRAELVILQKELDSGVPEEDAIIAFGRRINHPDIKLFITALLLARAQGSSLGSCLQRLNRFTRQRQAFRRKAKTAVAMQKLSSFGICGCSFVIGLIQITTNGESFKAAWHHPLGSMLLSAGGVLLGSGLVWMLYLGRSKL